MRRKLKSASQRKQRHLRIRTRILGTDERPRLCVYRSHKHFEAQLINDLESKTLLSASTRDKEFRNRSKESGGKIDAAKALGRYFARKAKDKGMVRMVFDRAGYPFHGRVRAFAESVRENGGQF